MQLRQDITGKQFSVSRNPEPKTEFNGKAQRRTADGDPMWTTQVYVLDEEGGEVISITTSGVKPNVTVGQFITPVLLEAIPWSTNGKSGVAFRAQELKLAVTGSAKKGSD